MSILNPLEPKKVLELHSSLSEGQPMIGPFIWISTDAGEALVAANEIAAIHWANNVRETQTRADLILKSGVAYKVYDFPMEPVLSRLQEGLKALMLPLQFVAANDPVPPQSEH